MMSRHSISVVTVGILFLLLITGVYLPELQAADAKRPSPATPAVGSGGSQAAKPAPPAAIPAAAKQVPAATQAAVSATAAPYHFQATGRPDPFKPFMETNPELKKEQEEALKKKRIFKLSGPISPLQQADIAQFRLVGIIGDQNGRKAMVENAAVKKFYPLMIGTYIGPNGGRVAEILPDRVIIEEPSGERTPKAKNRRVTVMLHKEDEGKQ
jgi:type IV pilus assembly protein PilP